ncbi:hypothetical protein PtA15_11A479 [Puccinia triticina]|nr:uncharacterized protein PtA15_11A479 [Puccinia triticina]WAQ89788.1 hypothetical protein PtA15_11A479 [Puccinia triticina]
MLVPLKIRLLSLQLFLVTGAWCAYTFDNLPHPLESPGKQNLKLKHVTRGYGTQNYVCKDGKWAPNGAEATLLYRSQPQKPSRTVGHHSYKPPGLPTFDILGVGSVTCKKVQFAPDSNAHNVVWLQLDVVGGTPGMAKRVYRTHTVGGVPPEPTCKPTDQPLKVHYSALQRSPIEGTFPTHPPPSYPGPTQPAKPSVPTGSPRPAVLVYNVATMHALQALHFASTLLLFIPVFAPLTAVVAYPVTGSGAGAGTSAARRSRRSPEEYDEEQIGVFAEGNGTERDFIWSKFSPARNYFGAGNPTKEIESMTLNLDNL